MNNKSQDIFRLFNKSVLSYESYIDSYGLIKIEKLFIEKDFFPAPEFFLNSFRVMLKKENSYNERSNGDSKLEKVNKVSAIDLKLSELPLPDWFKKKIKEFFIPNSFQLIGQYNPDLNDIVNPDQFFFIIDLLSEFIRPLLKKIIKNTKDKELEKILTSLKLNKKGDLIDTLNIIEGYADTWENAEMPLAATLLNLHPWIIDREKAILWLDRAIELFETLRDREIEYMEFKISAKGIVAIAGVSIISSYPADHPVYLERISGLRKLRQFAVTSMAKFVSSLLKKPERENIVSAAYCYYLTACMSYLTPNSGTGDHTLQNIENSIALLERVHGKKNDKSLADLQVLSGYYRIATASREISSCLNSLKDAKDCFKNAALIYKDISEESEISISCFILLCSKAISEIIEASEFYSLNDSISEYEKISDECASFADSLVTNKDKNILIMAYNIYFDAVEFTGDYLKKEKYIRGMKRAAERSEDKVLTAFSKYLISGFLDENKKERYLKDASGDLVTYAGERIKYKDYLNAAIAYYTASSICSFESNEKASMAYSYLIKDCLDKSSYVKFLPLMINGRRRVVHKDDFYLFLIELTRRALLTVKNEKKLESSATEFLKLIEERSPINVFSTALKRFNKYLDYSELDRSFTSVLEKCGKNNWIMIDTLIEAALECFDLEKYFSTFEKALSYFIENKKYYEASKIESVLAKWFSTRDKPTAVLWYERALAHLPKNLCKENFSKSEYYEKTIFEAFCLNELKLILLEMDEKEAALFYSQELNTLFKEVISSFNLNFLRNLGKVTIIPFFSLLRHYSTRAKSMKILSGLVYEKIDDFIEALGEKSINKYIIEIFEKCDYRITSLLLEKAIELKNEEIIKTALNISGKIKVDSVIEKISSFFGTPFEKDAVQAISAYGFDAIETLKKILYAKNEHEISAKSRALKILLGEIGIQAIPEILSSKERISDLLKNIILNMGPSAVEILFDVLLKLPMDDEESLMFNNDLIKLICCFKEHATNPAINLLVRRESRETGIKILRNLSEYNIEPMIFSLKNDRQRPFLINLLKENQQKSAPFLIKSLNDPDTGRHCKNILKDLSDETIDFLIEGLKDKGLQRHCEDLLIHKMPASIPFLIDKLKNSEIEEIIIQVLKRHPEKSLGYIIQKLGVKGYYRVCRDFILTLGVPSADILVQSLKDDSKRDIIISIILEMKESAGPALIKNLEQENIREYIIKILKKDPSFYIHPLLSRLKVLEKEEGVKEAIVSFGEFSIEHIISEMNSLKFSVGAELLIKIGPASIGAAVQLLQNDKLFLQGQTVLLHLGIKAIKSLIKILLNINEQEFALSLRVIERIKEVLIKLKDQSIPEIIETLNDANRSDILEEIVMKGPDSALETVMKRLAVQSCFNVYSDIILKIGESAIPLLIDALNDSSRRASSAEILMRFKEKTVPFLIPLLYSDKSKISGAILKKIGESAIIPLCAEISKKDKFINKEKN